jgi:hypothetical protein
LDIVAGTSLLSPGLVASMMMMQWNGNRRRHWSQMADEALLAAPSKMGDYASVVDVTGPNRHTQSATD